MTMKSLLDKHQSRIIKSQIRRVLLQEWDPIGVADEPLAQDEYDSYRSDLYELLVTRAPDRELISYLDWVVQERMGFSESNSAVNEKTINALRSIDLLPNANVEVRS